LVVDAWQTRMLSDGTRLQLGRTDKEQGFVVRPDGIFPIEFRRSGIQRCEDGSSRLANVINRADIVPFSGGHTHPQGRTERVSGLPGPEDGIMARATGTPAYVISERGAFKITFVENAFRFEQLAGKALNPREQGEVARSVDWWNANGGGSGVKCTFTPSSR
jgi:hypothetical protein